MGSICPTSSDKNVYEIVINKDSQVTWYKKNSLPKSALSKRTLKKTLDTVVLIGKYIKLTPISPFTDSSPLFWVSNGSPIKIGSKTFDSYDSNSLIWKFLHSGPFYSVYDMENHLFDFKSMRSGLAFCIKDTESNYPIGLAAFQYNKPKHLRIEIGSIWISPIAQGTKACIETCYLMLNYAFQLGYRRVEWYCEPENIKSRKACEKAGFIQDILIEKCEIIRGKSISYVSYRVLDFEWNDYLKEELERKIYLN